MCEAGLEALGVTRQQPQDDDARRTAILFVSDLDFDDTQDARIDQLRTSLRKQMASWPDVTFAGADSDAEILFHEVCSEHEINRRIAALPRHRSLSAARGRDPDWVTRFWDALSGVETHELHDDDLPRWLAGQEGRTIQKRTSQWALFLTLAAAQGDPASVHVLVTRGDGNDHRDSHITDLIQRARERGIPVTEIGKLGTSAPGWCS